MKLLLPILGSIKHILLPAYMIEAQQEGFDEEITKAMKALVQQKLGRKPFIWPISI